MHRGDQCQTGLSHFAMILQFEGDDQDTKWILQRDAGDAGGVEFFPCGNDFDWNWGSLLRFDGRTACLACNIAFQDNDWPNHAVTRQDVHDFINEQREMEYNFLTKNCQHFCYDFYKVKQQHVWIAPMEYEAFSGMIQHEWSQHGGWEL